MEPLGYQPALTPASLGLKARALARLYAEDAAERVKRAPRMWYFWVQPRRLASEEKWIDR